MLRVIEVISSLSGECKNTGYPMTFIRLYGCNNQCKYCDTMYSVDGRKRGRELSYENIMNTVTKFKNKYICITGGEPLLQKDDLMPLVYELVSAGYIVYIETNGTIEIESTHYRRSFSYAMDIKCPSSGMSAKNNYSNLRNLLECDEVKFVIADYNDFMFAKGIIKQFPTSASLIFSPVFDSKGKNNAKELAEWIMQEKLTNVRLGVQMHRILNIY